MALIHAQDPRRPVGQAITNGAGDFLPSYGTGPGYHHQVIQYPVMCALDILEYSPTTGGRGGAPVTSVRGLVSCPGCRECIS